MLKLPVVVLGFQSLDVLAVLPDLLVYFFVELVDLVLSVAKFLLGPAVTFPFGLDILP